MTSAVEEEIVRILRTELLFGSGRAIPLDAPLGELGLGLDSLAVLNAVTAIESAFGVELPEEALATSSSLSVSSLGLLVAESPRVSSRGAGAAGLDPTVPPRHHRMERLAHALVNRGLVGRLLWSAARLAWPAKRFLFARSRYFLLERSLECDPPRIPAPPGVELRRETPADAEHFAGLWPDFMRRWSSEMVAAWLRDGAIPLVAADGERIVAFNLLSASGNRGEVELQPKRRACWGLYLVEAPALRGRGIGLALLAYSLQVSRELGFRAQLTAVRHDNKPMLVACVQLLGFRRIGSARRTQVLGRTRWSWEIDGRTSHARRLTI